jgi:hypothetical protein
VARPVVRMWLKSASVTNSFTFCKKSLKDSERNAAKGKYMLLSLSLSLQRCASFVRGKRPHGAQNPVYLR